MGDRIRFGSARAHAAVSARERGAGPRASAPFRLVSGLVAFAAAAAGCPPAPPPIDVQQPPSGQEHVGATVPISVALQGVAPQDVTVEMDGVDVTSQLSVVGNGLQGNVPLQDVQFWPADGPHSVVAHAPDGQGGEERNFSTFFGSTAGLPAEWIPITVDDYVLIGNYGSSSSSTHWVKMLNFLHGIGYGSTVRNTAIESVAGGGVQILYGERHWNAPVPPPVVEIAGVSYNLPSEVIQVMINGRYIPVPGAGPAEVVVTLLTLGDDAVALYLGGPTFDLIRWDSSGTNVELIEANIELLTAHVAATLKADPPPPPGSFCQDLCFRIYLWGKFNEYLSAVLPGIVGRLLSEYGERTAAAGDTCSCTLCNFSRPGCGGSPRDFESETGGGGSPPEGCENCYPCSMGECL